MKRLGWLVVILGLLVGLLPFGVRAEGPEVEAKSGVLMDVATGTVLWEANAHEPLPPASVTKVMTMLLIMEAIDDGRIRWEDPVTASESAAEKGGSQVYLKAGETMTVKDMLKAIAVSSANDCACAMAEHIAGSESGFVDLMNARAEELGMEDTHFVNCTGLDDGENAAEHKTSAYDIALMSRQLLGNHPAVKEFTTIWMDTLRQGSFGLSNTNKLVRFYSGATGLKTGFTQKAGYCLSASAQREEMELVAVVMGCQTSQQRFSACKALLDYGFANYALITPRLEETPRVPVELGAEDWVEGVLYEEKSLLILKNQKNLISTTLEMEPQIAAPVRKGQRLGELTVRAGEQILTRLPVVAGQAVDRLSWGQIFGKVLSQILTGKG